MKTIFCCLFALALCMSSCSRGNPSLELQEYISSIEDPDRSLTLQQQSHKINQLATAHRELEIRCIQQFKALNAIYDTTEHDLRSYLKQSRSQIRASKDEVFSALHNMRKNCNEQEWAEISALQLQVIENIKNEMEK